jgi:large subunit ribosomal protein L18Ae
MYKEYRDLTRAGAVVSCYQDMASRHRARFRSVQIIKVGEVKAADVRRPYIKQILDPKLRFPVPHRLYKPNKRASIFVGKRPGTF